MDNQGLRWGLGLGLLAALVILFASTPSLEAFVAGTGLATLLPAAAPPLGDTARYMLAALAFAIPTVIGALIGARRDDEEAYDRGVADADAAPLQAAEQMVVAPAALTAAPAPMSTPAPATADVNDLDGRLARIEAMLAELPASTTRVLKTSPTADLDKTLRSIQRSLRKRLPDPKMLGAVRALQDGPTPEAVLARVEVLEARIADQLTEINARLAALGQQPTEAPPAPVVRLPTRRPSGLPSRRIGETVAGIRQSIESLNG